MNPIKPETTVMCVKPYVKTNNFHFIFITIFSIHSLILLTICVKKSFIDKQFAESSPNKNYTTSQLIYCSFTANQTNKYSFIVSLIVIQIDGQLFCGSNQLQVIIKCENWRRLRTRILKKKQKKMRNSSKELRKTASPTIRVR